MVLRTQRYTGRVAQGLPSLPARFAASQLKPALKGLLIPTLALAPFVLTFACGGNSASNGPGTGPTTGVVDKDQNGLADDLYAWADANNDGMADAIDINHDGKVDGLGVNTSGKAG